MARVRALTALMLVGAAPLAAQGTAPRPIDTDRPDFTDGTHTVARARFQLETGYTFQQMRGADGGHVHSLPEALLRVGVSSHVELRVGENYLIQGGGGTAAASVRGFDDLYLGTKISLTEAHGAVPALSVEAKANLPTGGDAVSAHRWLPGAAILLGWETEGPWGVGVELLATRNANDATDGTASISVQYQATSRLQWYGEFIGLRTLGGGATVANVHVINSGLLMLINNNVQVDARIGAGLNDEAPRYFFGFGFAVRR